MKALAWRWPTLAGLIAVVALAGWVGTERARFTADVRTNLRSIPLDASCDADGNLIDVGLANCVDIDGRFRVVHSQVTKVFMLASNADLPKLFTSFSADADVDRQIDQAMVQFGETVMGAARRQKDSTGR